MTRCASIVVVVIMVAAPVLAAPAVQTRVATTPIVIRPVPNDVVARVVRVRPHLTPRGTTWVRTEAKRLAAGEADIAAATRDAAAACGQAGRCIDLAKMPIEDAMIYMMMLASADAEQDLRDQLAEMERTRQQRQAMREQQERMKAATDALRDRMDQMGDLSEMESLRLQMLMDRRSKLLETLSNLMEKIRASQDPIVQNLK